LKKNQTNDFFKYEITNEPITTYKNKNRGRQPKNKEFEKIAVTINI
jgi:hypothetical protein